MVQRFLSLWDILEILQGWTTAILHKHVKVSAFGMHRCIHDDMFMHYVDLCLPVRAPNGLVLNRGVPESGKLA